jgi:hypothetical protein
MYVPTNAALWDAGRMTNQFTSMPFQVATPEQYSSSGLETIWARHCSTDRQRVSFSREVAFPDRPKKVLAALALDILDPSDRGHPLDWAELRINGTPVVRIAGTAARPLKDMNTWHAHNVTDQAAAAFRYGGNTLTVVGQKNHTGKHSGFCDSGGPDFGVVAEIYAEAEHDLTATVLSSTTDHSIDLVVTVANTGPSDVVPTGSTFYFGTGETTGSATVTDVTLSSPAGNCTATAGSRGTWSASCPLGRIPAGRDLDIRVHVDMQTPGCQSGGGAQWNVPTFLYPYGIWIDPNRKNDSKSGHAFCDGSVVGSTSS